MTSDDKPPLKEMIYLDFLKLPSEKLAALLCLICS